MENRMTVNPAPEVSSEIQALIEDLIGIDGAIANVSSEETKKDSREIKELKANLRLLRSQALYILDISIHIGRGAANIALRLSDINLSESQNEILTRKQVRTTIPVSNLLRKARTTLYYQRSRIMSMYYRRFGELWVVPEENFQKVQEALVELYVELEKQRTAILNEYSNSCRKFLLDIADICKSNQFDVEKTTGILKYYRQKFPEREEIRNNLGVTVTPPLKLPSISDLIVQDTILREAEAKSAIALTKIERENAAQRQIREESESVRQVRALAETQIKEHLAKVVDDARSHFLTLASNKMQQLLSSKPINNIAEKRKFQESIRQMQLFVECQDDSIKGMFADVEDLGRLFSGESYTTEIRKQSLVAEIEQIYQKYEPVFESVKVAGKGHRARAIANLEL
jgi:hypothetical protein